MNKYYVMSRDDGHTFVKEAEFFEAQGGLVEPWGKYWEPVFADSIEGARAAKSKALPGTLLVAQHDAAPFMWNRPYSPTPQEVARYREEHDVPMMVARRELIQDHRSAVFHRLRAEGTLEEKVEFILDHIGRSL